MKTLAKYLFAAAIAAITMASCDQKIENEFVNPKGTPVQFTLSGANSFTGSKAAVKVTANTAVPADVNVTLALNLTESTVKAENMSFPSLIINKGETEASGEIGLDPTGLAPDTTFKIVVKASIAGVDLAQTLNLSYTTDPAPEPDVPVLAIDGKFSEWDAEDEIAGEEAVFALKKVFTDDKLYFYLELNKTKLLTGKLAFAHKLHLCFDNADMDGEKGGTIWNGAKYDKDIDIWLMQNGEPNMITWGLDGFEHKEGVDGDVFQFEFCINRSTDLLKADVIRFGAFVDSQYCDTSSGSEVWGGESASIGSAPKAELDMIVWAKPHVGGITIDGDMSDWTGVETGVASEGGPVLAFKATYDADYLYFYNKRNWHDGLWGGGYYYFELDTDNNPSTSVEKVNGNTPAGGIDVWMYLYLFGGSSAEPSFNAAPEGDGFPDGSVIANILANGTTDKKVIETEVRVPRSNVGVKKGDTILIYTWGNKSGSNLKPEPVTLTLEN